MVVDWVTSEIRAACTFRDVTLLDDAALAKLTQKTLTQSLQGEGFQGIATMRRPKGFDLWAVAIKGSMNEVELRDLAASVLPA